MKSDITIRRAEPGDEESLALVGKATFLETFAGVLGGRDIVAHCASSHSVERYRTWLADPQVALWLVERRPDAAPIGYCVLTPSDLPVRDPSPDDRELKRIYVLSRFHGGGIGKRLVETVRNQAQASRGRRLLLGVYAENHDAIAFYRRNGFGPVGTRQFVVGGRAYDDAIMALSLE